METILNRMGNRVYGYDPINRLTRDEKQTVINPMTKSYGYDRNGNRDTFVDGTVTSNNSFLPNSNRMTNDAVGAVTQDLAGNQKSDRGGSRTFDYNDAGRLFQVKESGVVVATYYYNAFGQRTRKVTSQGITIYHYDLGGNLISETTGAGAAIRDYVQLGNMPVAQIDNNGATESISYIHTDHLGSPRSATNEAGNVIWGWNSDAFGKTAANQDPDGDGISTIINLRFAGQYYDAETELHYNYFRYYDPSTGRYITSDPIGLAGGLNTYSYVESNPTNFIDPEGLKSYVGYLVRLTSTGMKKVSRLTREQAIRARQEGKNVLADRRQTAKQIEIAANGKTNLLKHNGGHKLPDGSKGLGHFQNDNVFGHTFWGRAAAITASMAASLDAIADTLDVFDPFGYLTSGDSEPPPGFEQGPFGTWIKVDTSCK